MAQPPVEFDAVPADRVGGAVAVEVRARLEPRRDEMVEGLRELVELESPSDDPASLGRMAAVLEHRFSPFGPITRHEIGTAGACHLDLTVAGTDPTLPHGLVLCHFDTVWGMGSLAKNPFRVDEHGVARGPGCFDMKGGILLLRYALEELRSLSRRPRRNLRILFTSDEELRSATARPYIARAAAGAGVAFVLESPLPGGTLKTARKGTGTYRLEIAGRAAHAGVEPEKGLSAVTEMAHQVLAIQALGNPPAGTTVNVGVARGGERPNVVPAHAELEIDVRVTTAAERERVDAGLRSLASRVTGTRLTLTADLERPPLERTAAIGRLFERARAIAGAMGVTIAEGSTGGASDGNLVAPLGIPVLDGLGPEGDGAHAAHEQVLVESLPRRAALLAGLLAEI